LPTENILIEGANGMLYIWNKSFSEIIETVRAHFKQIPDLLLYEPSLFISISEECMIRVKIGKKIKMCGEFN
jgi:WD40 repeat protein